MSIRVLQDSWRDRRAEAIVIGAVGSAQVTAAVALSLADHHAAPATVLLHSPLLLALVLVLVEARRGDPHDRGGFLALAGFLVCWGIVAWARDGTSQHAPGGALNSEDLLVLEGYALAIVSVRWLAPGSGILGLVQALDAAVVAVVSLALAGEYIIPAVVAEGQGAAEMARLANPLLDFGILAFLVISFAGDAGGARVRTLLLAAAWAVISITDTLVVTTAPSQLPTLVFDLSHIAATWFVALAVIAGDDASFVIDQRDQRVVAFVQTALPFALLAPLVILTGIHSVAGQPVPVLTIGTITAAALLLGRQWLTATDSRDLYTHRERLVASLNAKTAELAREISDRKRAEIALRRSEERFRAVAEHLDEGLVLLSPAGQIVYANPTMAELSGLDRLEFVGRFAAEVLEPWDRWSEVIAESQSDADGPPLRREIRTVAPDGREVWVEGYGRAFRADGDDAPGTIAIAIDITGRKAAEEETRSRAEELARHNEALERLSSSTEFGTRGLEAAIREIAEVAASTLRGASVSIWLLGESRPELRRVALAPNPRGAEADATIDLAECKSYVALLSTERVISVHDVALDDRLGGLHEHLFLGEGAVAVVDAPVRLLGQTVGLIRCERRGPQRRWTASEESLLASVAGFTATVLEADKRQEALFEAARLAAVLGATPDFVAIWDANGRALYVNESARNVLGIDAETDLSTVALASFHPADAVSELEDTAIPAARATGHWSGESTVMSSDGRRIPVSQVILAHGEGGDGRYLATIMRDLSESRRAAAEREQLNQKLQEAQKLESLGLLAGGIAHDFNNLLQAILGNAQIARMAVAPSFETAHESLAELETAALRAGDLVRQLLAFAGGGRTGIASTDPSGLVEETVRLLLAVVTRHASLQLDLEKDIPRIEADPVQLRQVVMNLVTNAADAIGEAGGSIVVSTRTVRANRAFLRECFLGETVPAGDYVAIEVEDTGIGMDGATLARIFDPFFTTKEYGHGLGLAAVLGIVRSHGGAVHVQSEPGRGTTFTILLPPTRRESPAIASSRQAAA